tara:strand:+ start:228 stop:596 length:369 start_codon:yes stop_codon:yes gene_type:complete
MTQYVVWNPETSLFLTKIVCKLSQHHAFLIDGKTLWSSHVGINTFVINDGKYYDGTKTYYNSKFRKLIDVFHNIDTPDNRPSSKVAIWLRNVEEYNYFVLVPMLRYNKLDFTHSIELIQIDE